MLSVLVGKTPDSPVPKFWSRNTPLSRFYYLAFYSGNTLRTDLNLIVGTGKNWKIPMLWAPTLRYMGAPILAIVYGFSYASFYAVRNDPMHIIGFAVGHLALVIIVLGLIVPSWFDVFVPVPRREEGKIPYTPGAIGGSIDLDSDDRERMEAATPSSGSSSAEHTSIGVEKQPE